MSAIARVFHVLLQVLCTQGPEKSSAWIDSKHFIVHSDGATQKIPVIGWC